MASIFISNPIQTSSQWELIMTIIVPSIMVSRIIIKIIGFISTGSLQSKWPWGFHFCKVGAQTLRKLPPNTVWVACASSFGHHLHILSLIHQPQAALLKVSNLYKSAMQLVFQGEVPLQFLFFNCSSSYVCGGMPDVRMGRDTCHMHRASVRGRKFFHSKCISWS